MTLREPGAGGQGGSIGGGAFDWTAGERRGTRVRAGDDVAGRLGHVDLDPWRGGWRTWTWGGRDRRRHSVRRWLPRWER